MKNIKVATVDFQDTSIGNGVFEAEIISKQVRFGFTLYLIRVGKTIGTAVKNSTGKAQLKLVSSITPGDHTGGAIHALKKLGFSGVQL